MITTAMRNSFSLAIALTLSIAATSAVAGDVYQWKDANGVTHFTGTPPPNVAYKMRTIHENGTTDSAEDAPTKAAENPDCKLARDNLNLLLSNSAVQMDSDGDGKPDKTLTADDRLNQLQFAQATMKVKCESSSSATNAQSTGMRATDASNSQA